MSLKLYGKKEKLLKKLWIEINMWKLNTFSSGCQAFILSWNEDDFFCFKIILKDRCLKLEINIQIGSIFKIIVAWSLKNNFLICTEVTNVLFWIISYISFPFVNLMYDSSTLAMNLAFPSSPTTETMSLPSCGGHLT